MKEIPITSFRNLKIGQAEDTAAGTGCTVFLLGQDGAPAGLDVRGGGPASRESELLKPLAAAQVIHAIVLAGAVPLDWMRRAALCGILRSAASVLMSGSQRCRWSASQICLI